MGCRPGAGCCGRRRGSRAGGTGAEPVGAGHRVGVEPAQLVFALAQRRRRGGIGVGVGGGAIAHRQRKFAQVEMLAIEFLREELPHDAAKAGGAERGGDDEVFSGHEKVWLWIEEPSAPFPQHPSNRASRSGRNTNCNPVCANTRQTNS